jgi:hypothetical protein
MRSSTISIGEPSSATPSRNRAQHAMTVMAIGAGWPAWIRSRTTGSRHVEIMVDDWKLSRASASSTCGLPKRSTIVAL